MASLTLKADNLADFKFCSNWSGYESDELLEGECKNVAYSVSARNPPSSTFHLGYGDECLTALVE